MPAPASGGKGGGKSAPAVGGKSGKGSRKGSLGPNVAPNYSVPAHMARRVESGTPGIKGKWTNWPGME